MGLVLHELQLLGADEDQVRSRRITSTANMLPSVLPISTMKVTQSICQSCPSWIFKDVGFNTINNVKIDA